MSTQRDTRLVTARIGKGKAVHHYYPGAGRTSCATGGMGDADATIVEGATITCKKCLKSLELEKGYAHEAALAENLERTLKAEADASGIKVGQTWVDVDSGDQVEVTRVATNGILRVGFRHLSGERPGGTGTLPLAWFMERFREQVVEVADLHVRKVRGGSDLFRVLGSSLMTRVGHTLTVLWLENVLTRVRHCIRPDTLESHYVAVDQAGNPQPRVERVELHLEHNITRERYVFEGLEGEPGEGVRTLAWLRHRDSGKLYSMADWVVWADYTPVCGHGVRYHEPCKECGGVDPNADAYDAHMVATQEGELKAPQVYPGVPNTVEAWEAYAERVKASRDAAEAKVADLLVEVAELRSKLAGQTPAPAEFRVGDRILVRQYGEELEARVTFVGVGGQTIHAKVIGGLEVVRPRGEVRHA